jgi:hypothetical protein
VLKSELIVERNINTWGVTQAWHAGPAEAEIYGAAVAALRHAREVGEIIS